MSVYIGIGSNLHEPAQQVYGAMRALAGLPQTTISGVSSLYCTQPVGDIEQPDFINAVVRLETQFTAHQLLAQCQAIELAQGRERSERRNGPRSLDLDLLLFHDVVMSDANLTLPHPRMLTRAFVLVPLADIDPDLLFPNGNTLQDYLDKVDNTGVSRLNEEAVL